MIKLKKLIKDIPNCIIKGSKEILISGINSNSKLIGPGNIFIAKRGKTYDGNQFILEAIQAGACAVVTDLFDPSLKNVVQIIHPNPSSIEASLATQYYDNPSHELLMVGITGTNGKTTTSFLIKHLLDHFFGRCGLIGTIEYMLGEHCYQATHTTPDVITNHKLLREMRYQHCKAAVMEVTSHALDQGRVNNIDFDVAIFTNLTHDHLDYHQTFEHYAQTKAKLFENLGKEKSPKKFPKWAIYNADSPWSTSMLSQTSAHILSYGIEQQSDVQATNIVLESHQTRADVIYQGKSYSCVWPFIGRFNVYNCLAVMAVGISQGFDIKEMAHYLSQPFAVPGRLEPIPNDLGLKIYVDFAHTDDALTNVLKNLRELQSHPGRLIVVLGCGGDRDQTKRPKMAQACQAYADRCLITSDNPRSEDPIKICQDIAQGFTCSDFYQIEIDRKKAIQMAISSLHPEDILLIAGRGHETHQIFSHNIIEFDDRKVAAECCALLLSKKL